MPLAPELLTWLLDADPALRWQVERDLVGAPEDVWRATRARVATEGFGARLLAQQDPDGQWAGGAFFPAGFQGDEEGQPWTATTWSLTSLRDWGLDAAVLAGTAEKLAANSRWEYEDLPYWDGEVDCCINSWTLGNGAWLGVDVSGIARWFVDHRLQTAAGTASGWRARRAPRSTPRSTTHFGYPFRWGFSALNALDYFRAAALRDGVGPDPRLADAVGVVRGARRPDGTWLQEGRHPGRVWFETDVPPGEPSRWLTFYGTRVLDWWDGRSSSMTLGPLRPRRPRAALGAAAGSGRRRRRGGRSRALPPNR